MDEGWHIDVVARLGSQPHLMPALRIDELGTARDDIDAGFALAVVMRSGSNARRDACFAHPDGSAADRLAGQRGRAGHAGRLPRGSRVRLVGHSMGRSLPYS